MDSGLAASRRPGMTPCVGRGIDDTIRIDDAAFVDNIAHTGERVSQSDSIIKPPDVNNASLPVQ
jgi:hypothetical protein